MNEIAGATGAEWGITVLRVVVGIVFVAHGAQKAFVFKPSGVTGFMRQLGFPAPPVAAAVLTFVELVGGAALVLGLLTPWAAGLLAVVMLVAMLRVHLKAGFFLPNGVEFTLTLLAATVALALLGPGPAALQTVLMGS